MFDLRSICRAAVRAAPTYLVTRIPTVMAGCATCYLTLLLLMGPLSFFRTVWALMFLVGLCYAVYIGGRTAAQKLTRRAVAWLNRDEVGTNRTRTERGDAAGFEDSENPNKLD